RQPHDRRDDAPGRRDRARADRRHVHRPRAHRVPEQHGGIGVALSLRHGPSGARRRGPGTEADVRAPGDRSQHPAVRRRGSRTTLVPRRSADAEHRRPVRRGRGSGAMTSESYVVRSEPAAISWWRLLYWSFRRELWESRSIYLAPIAVAPVALIGFLIS